MSFRMPPTAEERMLEVLRDILREVRDIRETLHRIEEQESEPDQGE